MDLAKIRKKITQGKEGKEEKAHEEQSAPIPSEKESTPLQETLQEVVLEESSQQETFQPDTVKEETKKTTAAPAESEAAGDEITELLTFSLSSEEFAFRVSEIEEILRFQRITQVPKTPDYILGITSLRGKIIPVLDLKRRLSLAATGDTDEARKKILILKGVKGPIGAMIDRVRGVIRISPSEMVEPPAHLSEVKLAFIEGVVLHNNRFISVVRVKEVSDIQLK